MTNREDIVSKMQYEEWEGSIDNLIPATRIKTEEDVKHYNQLGYDNTLKLDILCSVLGDGIDVNNIYYDKNGFPKRIVYYVEEDHILMNLTLGTGPDGKSHFLYTSKTLKEDVDKFVKWMKETLNEKDYTRFIIATPRAYRTDIVSFLHEKDDNVTPEKYIGAINYD